MNDETNDIHEPRSIRDVIDALAKARGWTFQTPEERAAERERAQRALWNTGPEFLACHCAGDGGSGDQVGMVLERDPVILAHIDGQPVMIWENICSCPIGREYREDIEDKRRIARQQLAAKRAATRLGAAKIPPRFAGLTIETWASLARAEGVDAALVERVSVGARQWLGRVSEPLPGPGTHRSILLLAGNWGAGKSGLAAALLAQWLDQGRGALFRTAPQMMVELRAVPYRAPESDPTALTWDRVMETYTTVPLFVLDDLGMESGANVRDEYERGVMYQLIDTRMMQLRPTIITTSLTMEIIFARYGGALESRLNGRDTRRFALISPDLRATRGEGPA